MCYFTSYLKMLSDYAAHVTCNALPPSLLRGIVHPKKKTLSAESCSKPTYIYLFSWAQKKHLMVAIEFFSIFSHSMKVNFFQISALYSTIRVWNNFRVSKWWQHLYFGVTFLLMKLWILSTVVFINNVVDMKVFFQRYLTAICTYFTRWLIRSNSYGLTNKFSTICLNPSDGYV